MCEYCGLRKNLVFHHDFNGGIDDSVYITDQNNNGPVMVMRKSYGVIELSRVYKEINFCPMCGKELRKLDTPPSLLASRGELEMDAIELVDNLLLYGGKYAGDPEREIQELLDRQADITRQECTDDDEALRECKARYERMRDERDALQAKLDEYEGRAEAIAVLTGGKLCAGPKLLTEEIARLSAELKRCEQERDRLAEENEYHRFQYDLASEDAIDLGGQIDELTAERDEWKAKAESAAHDNPYVGLVRGKQWERKESSDYYCGRCGWKVTDHDSYCPECGGALHEGTPGGGDCSCTRQDMLDLLDQYEREIEYQREDKKELYALLSKLHSDNLDLRRKLENSKAEAETYSNMTIGQLANLKIHNRMMADLLTLDKLAEDYLSERKDAENERGMEM